MRFPADRRCDAKLPTLLLLAGIRRSVLNRQRRNLRMSRRLIPLLAFSLLLCPALSCDRQSSSRKTIAVIPKGVSHVFWQSVKAGADKAGREEGVDRKSVV